ncbi:MAG: DUF4982 domain-containing protein [Bacteroidia bacterium]|nr:DUF4982 domain-containing protein [Bacteroidia bacterium]
MHKLVTTALAITATLLAHAQSQELLLLEDWKFNKGAAVGAHNTNFNDSQWQNVTIPHDWAIAGPFDKEIDKQVVAIVQNGEQEATEKTGRSGSLPWIGEGWYRTSITIPEGYKYAELIFDGAMAEPHVWVNGQDVGYWAYGYNVFKLDITEATNNCLPGLYSLAVHLQNVEESSRWYPGAGLIRPVRLILHKEKHLTTWGSFARTSMLSGINDNATVASEARIRITSEVSTPSHNGLKVYNYLKDNNGNIVAQQEAWVNDSKQTDIVLSLNNALLWSPEHPVLYTLVTELKENDTLWDRQISQFGIRSISYSAEGFKLNGQVRKFKGVCLHHDLGPLGAAFNKAAFRRQIRLLKDIGCDAIRTAHNTPAPWQMEICDEMGMMVMAESFDMWKYPKCKNGYARFFDQIDSISTNSDGKAWWERDITNLVLLNRNYACNIMYSIGNEIPEQNDMVGLEYTRLMQELIHRLDGTRPCTQGMDRGEGPIFSGVWQEMDIPGFNYRLHLYQKGYENAPKGFVLGSETASTVSSRGVYKFPISEERGTAYEDGQISSYDLEACSWSNLPDDDWMWQDKMPWVIGEFVWTGFDYLGEPTPYDEYWPSRSSYFGIFDLAGLPKDRAYLYRTHWNTSSPTLHILPHWTWKGREGETTPIFVYTSYPEAELFINGKSQGKLSKYDLSMEEYLNSRVDVTMPWGDVYRVPDPSKVLERNRLDRYRLRWNNVTYEPGEIKVVAYDANGNIAETKSINTAGKPHHIELHVDRQSLSTTPTDANGKAIDCPDMAFITARIVDKNGNLCPDADNTLKFNVKGAAKFNSCCNGDATSTEVFVNPQMKAFHGELVFVIEAGKQIGNASISVTSPGLKPAKTIIEVSK